MTSKPDASPAPPLTIREAAAYLGIGVRTAYDLARSGALPAVRIGRSWRVRLADLDALLTPSPGPASPSPATPTQPHAPEPTPAQAPASTASAPAEFMEWTRRSSSSGF